MEPTIILGGGLGGLLLAHRLARRDIPVTVIDKNRTFGGVNGRWGDDPEGAPLISYKALGLEPSGTLFQSLAEGGAWDGLEPRRMAICDHLFLPVGELALPGTLADFRAVLSDRFPHQRAGLETFCSTLEEVYDGIRVVSAVAPMAAQAKALSRLRSLGRESYRDFLQRTISDPALRRILAVRIFSSQNTVTTMAAYLAKILLDGLYALPESGARLCDLLLRQLESAAHCTLRPNFAVAEVLFDAELQAVGVRSHAGEELRGRVVLGLDPRQLGRGITCPPEVQQGIDGAIGGAVPALSALNLIFSITPDLGRRLRRFDSTARLFCCDDVDLFEVLARRENGELDLRCCKINLDTDADGLPVRVYAELDCSLDAADFPAMRGRESEALRPVLDAVLTALERVEPDFREGISGVWFATPATFADRTYHSQGAASGFRDTPEAPRRLDQTLARHGLLQVGQWSSFGSGLSQLELGAITAYRALRRSPVAGAP